ncbi:hypothetical protein BKA67DRAFT_663932 [Truncatella angustata]|uniref:Fungal N-terminal domain-containing protein n=1 Tax=Truncatella angustata TaxID=152316 RepID=A0A9P8RL42_9PEZI|nr:uncharacterized protein BKA67DRAFT_663932 [Truncatella angustata]KAH6646066.1 hypothetical protein BKA67DRAFT_663932 [Truncatella angustata]
MSGIEAIVGLVAGGAGLLSLAIQLGESAMKLKKACGIVKDAPKTVSKLTFSLETMAIALQQLEEQRQHSMRSGVILARCIMECQSCTAEIQALVDKMVDRLTRHGRIGGKVYVAFKDTQMTELLHEVERTKSSLELAYMMYLAEEQRQRDMERSVQLNTFQDLLSQGRQKLPEETMVPASSGGPNLLSNWSLVSVAPNEPRVDQNTSDLIRWDSRHPYSPKYNQLDPIIRHRKRRNSKTHLQAGLKFPTWLCSQVWHLAVTRSQDRWSMHLRTVNVVPLNSPIFRYCHSGNLEAVRQLIEGGKATPLDVGHVSNRQRDLTLLEVIWSIY